MDKVFESEDIEGVVHFAASSQVGESMSDPLKYYDNNLSGTCVLLQSMVAHGVLKIVFSSTAATYGEPERVPILETDKTQPTNCYGETKLAMEHMMSWVSRAHGLKYVALRYFNACGAHPSGVIGEATTPRPTWCPSSSRCPTVSGTMCPSSAMTTPPRTAPASGTTSTSPTWPRPTSWPWTTCSRAGTTTSSTWATAWASPSRRSSTPPGPSPATPSPPRSLPAGRRPRPAHRLLSEGHRRAGLEAPVQRPGHHHLHRLELAQEPSQRLRGLTPLSRTAFRGRPPATSPLGEAPGRPRFILLNECFQW